MARKSKPSASIQQQNRLISLTEMGVSQKYPSLTESSEVALDLQNSKTLSNIKMSLTGGEAGSELLVNMLNNINVAMAYLDRDANFIWVNKAFANILGQPPEYFVGKNSFEINPSDENRALVDRILKTGRPFSAYNIPYTDSNHPERGTTYWDWTLQPIIEENEQISGIIFTAMEATERQRAEKALEESQALFQLLFETAPDANILIDHEGCILALNRQTERAFGYSRTELIGKEIELLIPERFVRRHKRWRATYMDHPHILNMGAELDIYGQRKDSSEFPVNVTLSPLQTDDRTLILAVVRDMSERKKVEHSLSASEARFHAIFDNAAIGIQLLDAHGNLLETNPVMQLMLGFSSDELRGMNFLEFTFEDDAGPNLYLFQSLLEGTIHQYRMEKRYRRKNGTLFWGRLNVSRFQEDPNGPYFVIVMVEDINELKNAEKALHSSEERFHTSIETLLDGFAILSPIRNPDGQIIDFVFDYINGAGCQLNRHSKEEHIGHTILEIFPGYKESGLLAAYIKAAETGEPLRLEAQYHEEESGTGQPIDQSLDIKAVSLGDGLAVAWHDITRRKQIQAELAEVQRRLLDQADEQRMHLARELHDGPIQDLYGLAFQVNELESLMKSNQPESELLEKTKQNLQRTINELRSMMSALRPPTLAPFGLEKTIRSHTENFQTEHPEINVHLKLMRDGQLLPENIRLALFRIYQESLNNIVRHARAHNIYVSFNFSAQSVELKIEDDGVGFEIPSHWVELPRQGHFGLVGMRERAEAMGGQMLIESSRGKGTRYHLIVPLPAS